MNVRGIKNNILLPAMCDPSGLFSNFQSNKSMFKLYANKQQKSNFSTATELNNRMNISL